MRLEYRILNVFTTAGARISGNPLCVFEDGSALDSATMQALARQFNLSETTFLLPATHAGRERGAVAQVRIFTPSYEMPFAGHPTLGTAHVCRALGLGSDKLALEMQAGVIAVTARGDHWTLQAAPATWRELDVPRAELADLLGIDAADIDERPLWVKAGKEQIIVPLTSKAAVRRVAPQPQLFQRVVSEDGVGMAYVFAATGGNTVLARFFFPNGPSVLEDPATGSATANFGGWCLAMQRPLPQRLEISQGEHADRPSTLQLHVDHERRIFVGGGVVALASGTLEL
jgi:PhzF family phenazine biosynthesis protein